MSSGVLSAVFGSMLYGDLGGTEGDGPVAKLRTGMKRAAEAPNPPLVSFALVMMEKQPCILPVNAIVGFR